MELDKMNCPCATLTWVIPVYNGEKYIKQAIDSILRQPCEDLEILVIDDGSVDRSLSIVQSYTDERVKWIHKENGGVSSARNLGIREAKSPYIAFLDADDVLCKNAYDAEINQLLKSENYDLLSFSYVCGDQNLKRGRHKRTVAGNLPNDIHSLDPYKHFCSFIYRRDLISNANMEFPLGIKYSEDVTFLYLVYQHKNKALGVDHNWFIYRNNSSSAVHNPRKIECIMSDSVRAWYMCKDKSISEDAKKQCDIIAFAAITEYIRLGCQSGIPVGKIREELSAPMVCDIMKAYDDFWKSSTAVYEAFVQNPKKFWWKQRVKGMLIGFASMIAQTAIGRKLYFRLKYKEDIRNLI